ncbi:hypothetical protein EDD22DRAFT_853140 [Suillus occidentalis]|nr:hypothetical protein EDD22DRAFT_853140 [Suillus occidentalis]
MNLEDTQMSNDALERRLQHLSSEAAAQAVVTMHADVEWRRMCALTTAWEIHAHEQHLKFLHMILEDEGDTYANASLESLHVSLKGLVSTPKKKIEDDIGFSVTTYSDDVTSFAVGDSQLAFLESAASSFSNVVTMGTCPIHTTSTVAISGSRLTGTTVVLVLVVTVSFQLQVIMGLLQLPIRMIHHILPDGSMEKLGPFNNHKCLFGTPVQICTASELKISEQIIINVFLGRHLPVASWPRSVSVLATNTQTQTIFRDQGILSPQAAAVTPRPMSSDNFSSHANSSELQWQNQYSHGGDGFDQIEYDYSVATDRQAHASDHGSRNDLPIPNDGGQDRLGLPQYHHYTQANQPFPMGQSESVAGMSHNPMHSQAPNIGRQLAGSSNHGKFFILTLFSLPRVHMYLDSGHTIQYAHKPDYHDSGHIGAQDHDGQLFMGRLDPPSQPGSSRTDDRYNYYRLQTHTNPDDSNFQAASEHGRYVSRPEQPAAAVRDGSQQQDGFVYCGYPQFHHNVAEVEQEPACRRHAGHSHPQVNEPSRSNMQVERGDYNPQSKQQQGQFLPSGGLEHQDHSQFPVANSDEQLAGSSSIDQPPDMFRPYMPQWQTTAAAASHHLADISSESMVPSSSRERPLSDTVNKNLLKGVKVLNPKIKRPTQIDLSPMTIRDVKTSSSTFIVTAAFQENLLPEMDELAKFASDAMQKAISQYEGDTCIGLMQWMMRSDGRQHMSKLKNELKQVYIDFQIVADMSMLSAYGLALDLSKDKQEMLNLCNGTIRYLLLDYCFADALVPASENIEDGLLLIPFGHSSLRNLLEYITSVKQYSRYLLLDKEGWQFHLKHALALAALAGHWALEKGLAGWSATLEFVTPASRCLILATATLDHDYHYYYYRMSSNTSLNIHPNAITLSQLLPLPPSSWVENSTMVHGRVHAPEFSVSGTTVTSSRPGSSDTVGAHLLESCCAYAHITFGRQDLQISNSVPSTDATLPQSDSQEIDTAAALLDEIAEAGAAVAMIAEQPSPAHPAPVLVVKRICREKSGTEWQTVLDVVKFGEEQQTFWNQEEWFLRNLNAVAVVLSMTILTRKTIIMTGSVQRGMFTGKRPQVVACHIVLSGSNKIWHQGSIGAAIESRLAPPLPPIASNVQYRGRSSFGLSATTGYTEYQLVWYTVLDSFQEIQFWLACPSNRNLGPCECAQSIGPTPATMGIAYTIIEFMETTIFLFTNALGRARRLLTEM